MDHLILACTALFAVALYLDWNNAEKRALDISVFFSFACTLLLGFQLIRSVDNFRNVANSPTPGRFVFGLSVIWILIGGVLAVVWGATFGLYNRDADGFKQDVTLKNEELKQVGVIMVTSHHVLLYSDGETIVVPASDVVKIEGGRR